jgi:precorrin-6A/cobalt-precorrin-6A reductase
VKVLILGGTGEARELAAFLVARGHEVTTALAGRTSEPLLPAGTVRMGGFGGATGLATYLRALAFDRLVDATHPYADEISANAVYAARQTGVPLVRLARPPWPEPAGSRWHHVASPTGAAEALPSGARVLVTSGHDGLERLLARDDCRFVVRLIEPPASALPTHAVLLIARPPYRLEDERELLARERITHLVSKNSGGHQTATKLDAARELGIEVIIIDRPGLPPANEVGSVAEAVRAIDG